MIATFLSQPVVYGTSIIEVVAVIALVPTLGMIVGHLICHQQGCFRLGRFPHGHYKLCHVHHPNVPSDGKITQAHIKRIGWASVLFPTQGGVVSTPVPFKLKPFTPFKVKADLAFVGALVAVFGAGIPPGISQVLIGGAALIAVGLNAVETYAEAHIHIGKRVIEDAQKALSEVRTVLPAVNELTKSLPGEVGAKVRQELELIEKGPGAGTGSTGVGAGR